MSTRDPRMTTSSCLSVHQEWKWLKNHERRPKTFQNCLGRKITCAKILYCDLKITVIKSPFHAKMHGMDLYYTYQWNWKLHYRSVPLTLHIAANCGEHLWKSKMVQQNVGYKIAKWVWEATRDGKVSPPVRSGQSAMTTVSGYRNGLYEVKAVWNCFPTFSHVFSELLCRIPIFFAQCG